MEGESAAAASVHLVRVLRANQERRSPALGGHTGSVAALACGPGLPLAARQFSRRAAQRPADHFRLHVRALRQLQAELERRLVNDLKLHLLLQISRRFRFFGRARRQPLGRRLRLAHVARLRRVLQLVRRRIDRRALQPLVHLPDGVRLILIDRVPARVIDDLLVL